MYIPSPRHELAVSYLNEEGVQMSKQKKSLIQKLKAYYQAAERDAAKAAPFYVTADGGLFANSTEVIRSKKVRIQLQAFAHLQNTTKSDSDTRPAPAAAAAR